MPVLPPIKVGTNKNVLIGAGVGGVVLLVAGLLFFGLKGKDQSPKKTGNNETASDGNKQSSKPKTTILKIKGLYLGMDIHSAVTTLKKQVPELDFVIFNPSDQPKSKNDAQSTVDALKALNQALGGGVETEQSDIPPISLYAKSRRGLVTIGASGNTNKNEVVYFLLDGDVVNKIFDASRMDEQRFLQTFVDAYHIPNFTPERKKVKDGLGNEYGYQNVYKHVDKSGFEIRIYSKFFGDKNKLRNNTLSARMLGMEIDVSFQPERTIELIKRKSASEASKSFD
jgi:stress-induced morphogen/gas vesicle protein